MFQQHPYVLQALVAERQAELRREAGAGRQVKAPRQARQPER